MRLSIGETAKRSGVSVRTLRYYDQIGLLRPAQVSVDNGYRWYGEAELCRLQEILFYRELAFPLRDIQIILSDPRYDRHEALLRQHRLLRMERDRLDRLLDVLEAGLRGEKTMEFQGFDKSGIETARREYAEEARARWGGTEAWRESQGRQEKDQDGALKEMNDLFRRFAAIRRGDPAGPEAQGLVEEWKGFITAHCYTCTDEILAGLGSMYTADRRFQENLDRFGPGTARFLSDAIAAYCKV